MQKHLEWNKAFSVLHPALDLEHRKIIERINDVIASTREGGDAARLRSLLCAVKEEAGTHFAHEDAILRGIAAATLSVRQSRKFVAAMTQALIDEHIQEHNIALASLEFMIRRTLSANSANAPAIGETLTHWFVNHAVKHDAHLKTLFQTIEQECPELLSSVA